MIASNPDPVALPVLTVRLIVKDDAGHVLLLKRPQDSHGAGGWCLPGGKVDFGDSVADSVDKELREETALDCQSRSFLFYQDSLPSSKSEMHVVNLYFECAVEGDIVLNDESTDHAWISRGDLDRYEIVFRNDEALRRYWEESERAAGYS